VFAVSDLLARIHVDQDRHAKPALLRKRPRRQEGLPIVEAAYFRLALGALPKA
jgi:hypothetical protein